MSDVVLAVDLGGTNIRMAAVRSDGTILRRAKRPTPAGLLPAALLALTDSLAAECRGPISERSVAAIGFAPPANVTPEGVLHDLPNIPGLDGFHLKAGLIERFGLPTAIENDATAAAIGESWLGASQGISTSIMVTLGTGVGGGVIIDGQPLRGLDGGAGKIGHIAVEPEGYPCGCGSRGCVEQYASATAIVRMAREAGLVAKSSQDVSDLYLSGDQTARDVFQRMGRYLGIMLAGLVNTLNPEMIVIGGGVAAAWDLFAEETAAQIRKKSFERPAERARIVPAVLGDDAGLLGAARVAFEAAD